MLAQGWVIHWVGQRSGAERQAVVHSVWLPELAELRSFWQENGQSAQADYA
jgi:hypothetical protein